MKHPDIYIPKYSTFMYCWCKEGAHFYKEVERIQPEPRIIDLRKNNRPI